MKNLTILLLLISSALTGQNAFDLQPVRTDVFGFPDMPAQQLQQGCGRTRRGREQDYDLNGERRGLVVVADENWHRVRKYLDDDFRESMVPCPGR